MTSLTCLVELTKFQGRLLMVSGLSAFVRPAFETFGGNFPLAPFSGHYYSISVTKNSPNWLAFSDGDRECEVHLRGFPAAGFSTFGAAPIFGFWLQKQKK